VACNVATTLNDGPWGVGDYSSGAQTLKQGPNKLLSLQFPTSNFSL